jgi:hypothetical protein
VLNSKSIKEGLKLVPSEDGEEHHDSVVLGWRSSEKVAHGGFDEEEGCKRACNLSYKILIRLT